MNLRSLFGKFGASQDTGAEAAQLGRGDKRAITADADIENAILAGLKAERASAMARVEKLDAAIKSLEENPAVSDVLLKLSRL